MSIEFLITTFVIVASPGTGVVYTLAAGLSQGGRASVYAAMACTLGIVPHLVAAMLGLAALLHTSALLFAIVKYAGVAYLLWMAWQTLREKGALKVEPGAPSRTVWRIMVDGIVINLLNPKLSIFFVAFLPQFIATDDPSPLARMLELSGVFMAMTFGVFALYGLFAAAMRDHVVSRPAVVAWMRRTFAAAFVALGARLALTER
ncbi:MAG: LysE family translocator [Rhizobiaceae bacterium]